MKHVRDRVGLLRVRPGCCLFTWRQPEASDPRRAARTIEIHDGHCQLCVAELTRACPDLVLVDVRSPGRRSTEVFRVLVVDDDLEIRMELEGLLREMGCEVDTAADGYQALTRLGPGNPLPGLILLDLMMPGMDGEEFLDRQAADPRLADIPVVVVTAGKANPTRVRPAGIIRKPFRVETIGTVVDAHRS
jgi:CheY-like chemotaxis protein